MGRSAVPKLFAMFVVSTVVASIMPLSVFAETIQFPTEELATESVLPVFDQPTSVRNRVVSLSKRIEIGFLGGYALTEPFYNPFQIGGTLSYHINEDHGINLFGTTFLTGLSNEASQMNPIPN